MIALLSGGLDSTVNLKKALDEGEVALALTFDYGQRSAKCEAAAAEAICSRLHVPHETIPLPWLAGITKTALVDVKQDLPAPSDEDLDTGGQESAKAVWVPNRNGVFLNVAAAYAESMECEGVLVGFNAEEGTTFPDNSRLFFEAANVAFAYSTLRKTQVICYTLDMGKAEIVRFGRKIGAPLDLVWPCYESGPNLCWRCESCRRLHRALAQTGNLEWFERLRRR